MHRMPLKLRPLSARCRPYRQLYSVSLLLLVLCLLLLAINVRELRLMHESSTTVNEPVFKTPADGGQITDYIATDRRRSASPIVWITGKKVETGYLKHVTEAFERLGYEIGNQTSDWSVLWSHDYPFSTLHSLMKSLKAHQRVNHWPGAGLLTNKVHLALSDIDVIPKAFLLPSQQSEFLSYITRYPGKQWVQKGTSHRGIRITSGKDLIASVSSGELIVQQYVDSPLLVDGRRFDIGLYVTITSISPLRVYVFQGEWLIRFCNKEYHPFDARDVDKYVIGDDYSPVWEIKSLEKFYNNYGSTRKEAFFAYLRSIGENPETLNNKLEDAIRRIVYMKGSEINALARDFLSGNFFEMVRFDFVIDDKSNVYLLEATGKWNFPSSSTRLHSRVNMSPNLSSGHFAKNQLLYEQIIYSTLHLVGLADRSFNVDPSSHFMGDQLTRMQVSTRDLSVHLDTCTSSLCTKAGCQSEICKLCRGCLNTDDEMVLVSAYLEHTRRAKWHRVVPQSLRSRENALKWNLTTADNVAMMTSSDRFMSLWFYGKCLQDVTWC